MSDLSTEQRWTKTYERILLLLAEQIIRINLITPHNLPVPLSQRSFGVGNSVTGEGKDDVEDGVGLGVEVGLGEGSSFGDARDLLSAGGGERAGAGESG